MIQSSEKKKKKVGKQPILQKKKQQLVHSKTINKRQLLNWKICKDTFMKMYLQLPLTEIALRYSKWKWVPQCREINWEFPR